MKSENKIIVRCKQPIKIEKGLQCLLMALMKEIFFELFPSHFFGSFYFLNALQSDTYRKTVYFLGHKYILAFLRAHCNPRLNLNPKMSLSRAKNIFMPMNINATVLFYKSTTPWPVLAYFYGNDINGISHIVCKPQAVKCS